MCTSCSTVHYENPKILIACLVHWRNRIVLCRRAIDPGRGYWYPPTGFVENGESLEEAAVRELSEETAIVLSARRMRLYGVASLPHLNQVYVAFRCKLTAEPALRAGKESLEARLFAESEIPFHRLAFGHISARLLHSFFRLLHLGKFPVHSVRLERGLRSPEVLESALDD